ncbi:hypothetical protein [Variimorphobacter saccharofermentans]|uniref:hypothetical protein n=1 Tax=Variimorphobacter saccharofermentans TaxID=2755051 RepID=UPI001E304EC6|nr:hypothetical protein [Variimorphobacter saccharofermentans]
MNNDNVDNNKQTQHRYMKSQQIFQGGPGRPSDRPGTDQQRRPADRDSDDNRIDFTPGPQGQFPGAEAAPRSAPPNFIPEAPQMESRTFGAPGRPGVPVSPQFGFVRPGQIRRCIHRYTFIWLVNGNSFWFYPTFVGNQFVQGFRWRRNRWEFERINLRRILFFRCF